MNTVWVIPPIYKLQDCDAGLGLATEHTPGHEYWRSLIDSRPRVNTANYPFLAKEVRCVLFDFSHINLTEKPICCQAGCPLSPSLHDSALRHITREIQVSRPRYAIGHGHPLRSTAPRSRHFPHRAIRPASTTGAAPTRYAPRWPPPSSDPPARPAACRVSRRYRAGCAATWRNAASAPG